MDSWARSEPRAQAVQACVQLGITSEDHRVGFTLLGLGDGYRIVQIVDIVAIPPSSLDQLESAATDWHGARIMPLDAHFGSRDGKPCLSASVATRVAHIGGEYPLLYELVADLFHARQLAFVAARRGRRWTGVNADFPSSVNRFRTESS
jgi:hypothetical protein